MELPTDTLTRIATAAITAAVLVGAGFAWGYHARGVRQAVATQKQVVKVAKEEAKDEVETGHQNDSDAQKIEDLERRVANLLANPAPARVVRVRDPSCSLQAPQGNASAGGEASPGEGRPVRGPDDDLRALHRADLLKFAQEKAELRLAIRSCQAQWPK